MTAIFIGKEPNLFSLDKRVDRVHSKLTLIGVLDESRKTTRVRVKGARLRPARTNFEIAISRWQGCKTRAAVRNIPFDVTIEFIQALIESPCGYCLCSEKLSEIDRKEPVAGYTMTNTVPACRRCNMVKNNILTYEEMMLVAKTLGWRKA